MIRARRIRTFPAERAMKREHFIDSDRAATTLAVLGTIFALRAGRRLDRADISRLKLVIPLLV
jgi:hypothetical protein